MGPPVMRSAQLASRPTPPPPPIHTPASPCEPCSPGLQEVEALETAWKAAHASPDTAFLAALPCPCAVCKLERGEPLTEAEEGQVFG